jgi:hypothetical protein
MIQLEKYKGTRTRHTCPACNTRNQFTRFVNTETGEYLPNHVGICNRASKCGYRYTAKQYYADNPTADTKLSGQSTKGKKRRVSNYGFADKSIIQTNSADLQNKPDYIPFEHFTATLDNYDRNSFVRFLLNLFPDCLEKVQEALKMYFVGTYEDYTCFASIDRQNRICRAKVIRFDRTSGKRLKGEFDTSSLPAKLKLKENFQYKQIFFGEHLLSKYPTKPVAIVESEKTAIIASLCLPDFVWLGCNSKQWLKVERLRRLGSRQIILYPDADGFTLWQQIAEDAKKQGLTVQVSNFIETRATTEQKKNGYDLADYLISQQNEINAHNEFIEAYNAKLQAVLNDECLYDDFEMILEERKSILMYSENLSEAEAEKHISCPDYFREVMLNL